MTRAQQRRIKQMLGLLAGIHEEVQTMQNTQKWNGKDWKNLGFARFNLHSAIGLLERVIP